MFWVFYCYVVLFIISLMMFIIWSLNKELGEADEYIEELESRLEDMEALCSITMN